MEKKTTLEAIVKNKVCLWFLPYTPEEVLIMNIDQAEGTVSLQFSHSFDYEEIGRNRWRVHIDIKLDVKPFAVIKTRLTYEINCIKSLLFHPVSIDFTNKMALELAQKGFIEYCETHQIEQPLEEIQDWTECAKSIRDGMIERSQSRFRDDELNPKGKVGLLTLTPGKLTLLLVNGTFMILDEVLHSNKAFDLAHNQEVFHDIIPESVYYTTKLNCMALEKGTIKLKFVHNIFFQICIDCALQLILDNHFEKLIPVMNERGFNEEKQQKYINYGNKFLNEMRESYKKSGATIENLQTRYDWNSMLK